MTLARITSSRSHHFVCSLAAGVLLLLSTCGGARGDDNIRAEMREVATAIGNLLQGLGEFGVEIDEFAFQGSDSKLRASGGAGLARTLTEELELRKVAVKRGGRFKVRGSYGDVLDSKSRVIAARFQGEMIDSEGRVLTTFSRGIFGDAALASLFGVTGDFDTDEDIVRRSKSLENMLDAPKTHLDRSVVSTASVAPYAIELLCRSGDEWIAKAPRSVDGQATLNLEPGQEFAVRIINRSSHEAAVFLTVDGLGLFTVSENRALKQVIVPSNSSSVVLGWHRRGDEWEGFRTGIRPAGAKPQRKVDHVVTAVFSACWKEDVEPPADEPPSIRVRRYSRCGDPAGTELGLPAELGRADAAALAEIPGSATREASSPGEDSVALAELPDAERDAEAPALAEIPNSAPIPTSAETKPYAGSGAPIRALRREFGVVRAAVSLRISPE